MAEFLRDIMFFKHTHGKGHEICPYLVFAKIAEELAGHP